MTSVQAQTLTVAASTASSSWSSGFAFIRLARVRSASPTSKPRLRIRRPHSVAHLFHVYPSAFLSSKRFDPVMQWQDCTVKKEVNVPASVAYQCYSDREAMPKWMPFISSVKILEDKPDVSQWNLKYKAFGQDIKFSWLARNLQPIPNQKIHWRSLEGLPNRGAVRFYPKGSSSCLVDLTVSYEIPPILTPVASALQPFLEGLLLRGLESFTRFAKDYEPENAPSS